jgi:hypothetical protein
MTRIRLRRIPRRYGSLVMTVTLSVSMSAVVTLIVTIHHHGVSPQIPSLWLAAWQMSCAIAVPTRFVVAPLVARLVGAVVEAGDVEHQA